MNIGDKVTYKANGVCTVDAITELMLPGEKEAHACYVLRPLSEASVKIFVPTDSEALMAHLRPILSGDEMLSLFDRAKELEMEWIPDLRARGNAFRDLLAKGDRESLCAMIKQLTLRREELLAEGKKLYAADETMLKKAEKMLFDEASYVLEMSYEDTAGLFAAKLSVH